MRKIKLKLPINLSKKFFEKREEDQNIILIILFLHSFYLRFRRTYPLGNLRR